MKKQYRSLRAVLLLTAALLALALVFGCGREKSAVEQGKGYLLYVEQGGMSLLSVAWEPSGGESQDMAEEVCGFRMFR